MTFQPFSSFDPHKPRAVIQPYSARRLKRVGERAETIKETKKRAGGRCEAAELLPSIRCVPPMDVHEVATRARTGGTSAYDSTVTMHLCRAHHDHVTTNPAEAEALGLMVPSGPSPKTQLLYDRRRDG